MFAESLSVIQIRDLFVVEHLLDLLDAFLTLLLVALNQVFILLSIFELLPRVRDLLLESFNLFRNCRFVRRLRVTSLVLLLTDCKLSTTYDLPQGAFYLYVFQQVLKKSGGLRFCLLEPFLENFVLLFSSLTVFLDFLVGSLFLLVL